MCEHSDDDYNFDEEIHGYMPPEEFQELIDHKWEYLSENSTWDDEDNDSYEEEFEVPAEPNNPPNWNYDTTYNGSLMSEYPFVDDDYDDLDTDEAAEYPY